MNSMFSDCFLISLQEIEQILSFKSLNIEPNDFYSQALVLAPGPDECVFIQQAIIKSGGAFLAEGNPPPIPSRNEKGQLELLPESDPRMGYRCELFLDNFSLHNCVKSIPWCHVVVGQPKQINNLLSASKLQPKHLKRIIIVDPERILNGSSDSFDIMHSIIDHLPIYKQFVVIATPYSPLKRFSEDHSLQKHDILISQRLSSLPLSILSYSMLSDAMNQPIIICDQLKMILDRLENVIFFQMLLTSEIDGASIQIASNYSKSSVDMDIEIPEICRCQTEGTKEQKDQKNEKDIGTNNFYPFLCMPAKFIFSSAASDLNVIICDDSKENELARVMCEVIMSDSSTSKSYSFGIFTFMLSHPSLESISLNDGSLNEEKWKELINEDIVAHFSYLQTEKADSTQKNSVRQIVFISLSTLCILAECGLFTRYSGLFSDCFLKRCCLLLKKDVKMESLSNPHLSVFLCCQPILIDEVISILAFASDGLQSSKKEDPSPLEPSCDSYSVFSFASLVQIPCLKSIRRTKAHLKDENSTLEREISAIEEEEEDDDDELYTITSHLFSTLLTPPFYLSIVEDCSSAFHLKELFSFSSPEQIAAIAEETCRLYLSNHQMDIKQTHLCNSIKEYSQKDKEDNLIDPIHERNQQIMDEEQSSFSQQSVPVYSNHARDIPNFLTNSATSINHGELLFPFSFLSSSSFISSFCNDSLNSSPDKATYTKSLFPFSIMFDQMQTKLH